MREISDLVAADVYINVQGDEPLTRAEHIAALIDLMKDPDVQVGTLKTPASPEDINNPNAVKVVTDRAGRALYFSRATIPYDRDAASPNYFKHLGFYAYRKAALDRFCALPESPLERSERLEQLRFLENGIPIQVGETPYDTVGVDTEDDLRRVEEIFRQRESVASYVSTEVFMHNFYFRAAAGGCNFAHASAANTRREIAGCDWKNHSTHRAGDRSARFCSASLFMDEMNGSTLAMD